VAGKGALRKGREAAKINIISFLPGSCRGILRGSRDAKRSYRFRDSRDGRIG
jgi:hypothetical protein